MKETQELNAEKGKRSKSEIPILSIEFNDYVNNHSEKAKMPDQKTPGKSDKSLDRTDSKLVSEMAKLHEGDSEQPKS